MRKFQVFCLSAILLISLGRSEVLATELDTKALEERYPVLALFRDVQLHGFVDTGFNYNFNQPDSRSNNLRIFDGRTDSFTLNMVELSLENELGEGDSVGFRFDLDFGKDANVTAPADTRNDDEFDLEEAYIVLRCPISGVDFKFGKFVTLLGAEVIEAPLNYNYSRSFLFGYAIPFTHTGLLASYVVNDMFGFSAGVVNGWDIIEDNNDAKTFLGNVAFSHGDLFSLSINGVYGAEQDGDDTPKRGVVDVVASLTPIEKLTFMVNYDYGEEEDAVVKGESAIWSGVAGYIHYDALDWLGFTVRSEFFNDDDGARTGTVQELWEITFTTEFRPHEGVIARVEYRHDESDKDSFTDEDGGVTDSQDTIGFELAYTF